ncbi:MAG: YkgJ family cysteine cluster protein [Caulobacter sp.]|nr:YkgJ family cysteine cluster protein [Caulobacter sp.]
MCCKLMGVAAIDKPAHAWCGHYRKGAGCAIYADRPQACADYACYWLNAPNLDDRWRPDRARFVLHREDEGRTLVVEVDPASPDAWRMSPFHESFRAWAARGAAQGLTLNVLVGRRGWTILPDRDVDHGLVREIPA